MAALPKLSNYSQAEAWLLSITDYERSMGTAPVQYDTRTFDIERFRNQLSSLGDPHLRYAAIHVAGTKGKGSTCAFLESALRNCGYRTGMYTSPHLCRFTERIRVNGNEIPDEDFCRLTQTLGNRLTHTEQENEVDHRSFRTVFEILTASAFQYFAEQKIDIAIVETGLGGRLDSTNVFDKPGAGPLINVITAIGLDHTAILGNTVDAIAAEKAGIIRPHAGVVVAAQLAPSTESAVRRVVQERCTALELPEPIMVSDSITISKESDTTRCWNFQWYGRKNGSQLVAEMENGATICPSLEGRHQASNVATALAALVKFEEMRGFQQQYKEFYESTPKLDFKSITQGLEETRWSGRFQIVRLEVPVVIDGAHCALSAAALAETLQAHYGDKPAVVVTGFLKDKAGEDMLGAFASKVNVAKAIALPPPTPRAVDAAHIKLALDNVFGPERVSVSINIKDALETARKEALALGGYVVVFGSLYHVGPALDSVGYLKSQI